MQIFYHVTRDIELPRAGRRTQPTPDGRGCEACGRRIVRDPATQSSHAALAFCDACRARLDASAIQIHFCDACGVSLPLDDVQGGEALARDGRILCPACLRAVPGTTRRLLWIALFAACAAVLGVVLAHVL